MFLLGITTFSGKLKSYNWNRKPSYKLHSKVQVFWKCHKTRWPFFSNSVALSQCKGNHQKNRAKWIWGRSIFSIIKPSFDIALFQYFWNLHKFARNLQYMNPKLFLFLLQGVTRLKLFRNNNENNFAFICCKFLANLCKSSEILKQCHVNWGLM